MTQSRAIVIPEPNRIELRQVTITAPGDADVTVRTAFTSISAGTERMLLAGRMPHPLLALPVVPGYETVGRVVARGADVPEELEGRWVYVGGARCFEGVNPAWGGQSQTLVVDHQRVVPLDGVDPRQGVLLALAATALHGVDLLGNLEERRVLVLGQGPVGQLAARIARSVGAWVAVADKEPSRLARARADQVVDVSLRPAAEAIAEPVEVIIEATGSMTALEAALPALGQNGTVLLLGYYDELRLPYMPLFLKQIRLLTAKEWAAGDLERCRDMLVNKDIDVGSLLTHRRPVAQFAEAYELALKNPECLKVVLEW
jgi:3-hydroxyethyl bacteriochlorophyllide a dehydrogenase